MELTGLLVSIALALTGYFVTYLNNLRLTRRADRLKFVTTQIDELYGPLYVITQGGEILFQALKQQREQDGRWFVNADTPRSTADISNWRIWVEQVFQPLNQQLEEVIINKAHLVIEEEMPDCLTQFLAHSAGYKAVIKKWELGDFSESYSSIPYPKGLGQYAEDSYKKLRNQQLNLIGR